MLVSRRLLSPYRRLIATGIHMHIRFITTGGTIDKIYFDALSQFEVGESQLQAILDEALVDCE